MFAVEYERGEESSSGNFAALALSIYIINRLPDEATRKSGPLFCVMELNQSDLLIRLLGKKQAQEPLWYY
jgi:hypothetical protein